VTDLTKRLEALERRVNAERPAGSKAFMIILIGGCFTPPGEVPAFANCGELGWLRNPGEAVEAFGGRCALEVPPGSSHDLIIGGLPATQEQYQHAIVAYDAWLAREDGVPPVTSVRGRA
jgi:hypothetical protein